MTHQRIELPNDRSIYLVQRILEGWDPKPGNGVDGYFSFDYMGSAEFEFGELPRSLKAMRRVNLGLQQPQHVKFKYLGRALEAVGDFTEVKPGAEFSFSYLGPAEFIPAVRKLFELEAKNQFEALLKERTNIARSYELDHWDRTPKKTSYRLPIGWWDVQNHWVAFKNAKHTHMWIEGLNAKPKSSNTAA